MDPQVSLENLLELAEEMGITVRRIPAAAETSEHPGGALVRLRGEEILFLDPAASVPDQISVVAAALRGREEIENRFLPPEIRRLIDEAALG